MQRERHDDLTTTMRGAAMLLCAALSLRYYYMRAIRHLFCVIFDDD